MAAKTPPSPTADKEAHDGGLDTAVVSSFINEPSATQAPSNAAKIGRYAYLGCFGSRTGFQTFSSVEESDDMSLEKCVKLWDGKSFAGVFEGKCHCAEALDADTRAMSVDEGAVCDHACPGNSSQSCGGLREKPAGMAAESTMMPEKQRFPNATSVSHARAPLSRAVRRNLPSTYLLSVYGDVAEPDPPAAFAPPLPPMASGATGTRPRLMATASNLRTVYPLQSATGSAASKRPYATGRPMSGKPIKLAAKPKMTHQDMPSGTTNSSRASNPATSSLGLSTANSTLAKEQGSKGKPTPSPTTNTGPPRIPQQMAAGNRVQHPLAVESDPERPPPAPGQFPKDFGQSLIPDRPGSSTGSRGYPEILLEGPNHDPPASEKPQHAQKLEAPFSPAVRAAAPGMRRSGRLAATLCAAVLAVAIVS